MTHRFPIKEIAAQAGLGTATVDRVLNNRSHVSARTRARVATAVAELTQQESHLAAKGRQVWVDVVGEMPSRFARELVSATEQAAANVSLGVVRPRFHLSEVMDAARTVQVLDRIARRGTHGVCLKARDVPEMRNAVAHLQARKIPVIALVTDIKGRDAYAGMDNAQAGRTAAALVARELEKGWVLTSASRHDFAGETARLHAFADHLHSLRPAITIRPLTPGAGLNTPTGAEADTMLSRHGTPSAIYSVGGGNRAITATLARHNMHPKLFIGHDLDDDNRALLARGALSHVLWHDLGADMTRALHHILAQMRLRPHSEATMSQPQIIIAENLPREITPRPSCR